MNACRQTSEERHKTTRGLSVIPQVRERLRRRGPQGLKGSFLDNAPWLDADIMVPEGVAVSFRRQLGLHGPRKRGERLRTLRVLLGNLFVAWCEHKALVVPLDRNDYGKSGVWMKGFSHTFFVEAVDALEREELVDVYRGFKNDWTSRKTRLRISERLGACLNENVNIEDVLPEGPLVVVRDARGKNCPFRENNLTRLYRSRLAGINEFHRGSKVTFDPGGSEPLGLGTDLHAVFRKESSGIEELLHGRMYTRRAGYQNISKVDRRTLRIDGLRHAELDYGAIHIMLLHALEGVQWPLDQDPYLAPFGNATPRIRDYAKVIVNAALNARDKESFQSACAHMLRDNRRYLKLYRRHMESKGFAIGELYDRILEGFPEVAHHISSGIGLRLHLQDAEIALNVVETLQSEGCPCLPIHDSFLVRERDRDLLHEIMKSTYRTHTGGCEIDVK